MRHVSFDNSKQDLLNGTCGNVEEELEEKGEDRERESKSKLRRKVRKRKKFGSSASEDEGSLIRRRLWRKLVEEDCKSSGTDVTFTSSVSNLSNTSVVETPPDFRAVIFIWSFSLVYALFEDQLMSKEPLDMCSLTSSLSSQLHLSSVLMVLVLPFILGPVLATVLSQLVLLLEQRKVLMRRSPSQTSISSTTSSSSPFLGFISLLHLLCCGAHMLAADWLYPVHIDLLTYMLVKYCLGFFFLLAFPMAVLICHPEVGIFFVQYCY